MEVKEGYIHTEIGVIPKDWEVTRVNELLDLLTDYDANGSFASVAENVHVYDSEEFAWYVRSTDLENNSPLSKVKFVDESSYNFLKKTKLNGGELLFLKRGDIGRVYLFKMRTKYATVAPNLYLLKINSKTMPIFLYYFFNTNNGQQQLKSKNASSTLGALYKDDVKSILIPLPPLSEQQAIAEVLTDTDNLIQALEKQIAKKKLIKQGVMQQLLTPKEGWVKKMLPEVCWFQEGPGLRNWQFTNSGIKVINVTNLSNGILNLERTSRYISLEEFNKMYRHFEIAENDIVVASSGNSYAKVAVVRKQDLPLLMNTSVIRFQPYKNLDYNYLLVFLNSPIFKDQIDLMITGGAQPNFGPAHLKRVTIELPASIEEQIEISSTLMNIQQEIEIIEYKLHKTKQLKQGIMQNLLTGKIRLTES